ncbi:glycosyltransferase WbsX family protein [Lapidilactobacillus luobeiensis]|uniref:glycosyltransferase WbsX family protein n=1 Tax=Lapidilactobacillus luobeiensis TaxID=2950371 RepID=UPI0021C466BD|nr:glycoside hydrolase family 99-like domain-containing protein [Lapidilactobacillus luobeiensis]
MKVLAYNLPAYHQIPENDKWWGEGFTEWDNVRSGKPLFKGHIQPMVPYGEYYYDLSKKEDVVYQAELAKQYGLSGFVYYHYWFNGKLLLERPVEIYRDSKDTDFDYCLCWANEQWAKTWDGKDNQILMPQTFGGREDWENHLQYFLTFFNDKRYIKRGNCPMLFVYSASKIPHFDEMMEYWNSRIKEYGYDSIYLVEFISTVNRDAISEYSQAVTEFEPMYSNRFGITPIQKLYRIICKKLKTTEYLSFDQIWTSLLKRKRIYGNREIIQSAFTQWDNTPRKGKSGLVLKGGSPEKFENYFRRLAHGKRVNASGEYMVINAWNEWGEGPVLEPSEQYGYKYLEGLQRVIMELENDYEK